MNMRTTWISYLWVQKGLTLTHYVLYLSLQSALDGFRVTNSGSVMIPSGFTKPLMMHHQRRSSGTPSTNSSSYGSSAPPDPYQSAYRHSSSLPGSLPRYSAGVPRSLPPTALPRSLPMYYSQHQPISMGMAHHGAPMPHNDSPMPYHGSPMPYHCYPPQYAYQGMNGW
jgi:hypothetical protein